MTRDELREGIGRCVVEAWNAHHKRDKGYISVEYDDLDPHGKVLADAMANKVIAFLFPNL